MTDTMTLGLVAALAACGGAHHDDTLRNTDAVERSRPSFDQTNEAIRELAQALPYLASPTDAKAALAVLGTPLWFDGFTYSPAGDEGLKQRCTAKRGVLVAPAELDTFVACAAIAQWRFDVEEVDEVSLAKLPAVFAQHRARLSELAVDHVFATTHFCPAAPGDYWTLYAATTDKAGHVVVDAILVSNDPDADCSQP